MFVIRWTNDNPDDTYSEKKDVQDIVDNYGNDGAILKWLDSSLSNGVIIYYNKVIGYISYERNPFNIDKIKELHLNVALRNMPEDELVDMIEAYNEYIQEIASMRDIEIEDVLTWSSVSYKGQNNFGQ